MAIKLVTAQKVIEVTTSNINQEPEDYNINIVYCQEVDLKPLLGVDFYNDFLNQYNSGPLPTNYQLLYDLFIESLVCFSTSLKTIEKELLNEVNNQGIMKNRTDYSDSADLKRTKNTLTTFKNRLIHYQYDLLCYLFEKQDDYPLFDDSKISFPLNARGFTPY